MTTAPQSPADLTNCHLRQSMHLNGGSEFFGYVYQCVEHPRLSRTDKYFRKGKSTTSTWSADGVAKASLEEAIAAIQSPAILSDEEQAALAMISDEWTDLRGHIAYGVSRALCDKGMIEVERGRCRRRSD